VVPVTGIDLFTVPGPLNLATGSAGLIQAELRPYDVSKTTLNWTSSDPSVATVTSAATPVGGDYYNTYVAVTVAAVAPGSATITATSPWGPTASVTVNVANVPVTGVSLPGAFEVGLGKTRELPATVVPAVVANQGASWASSNTSVATVSGAGLVGAVTGASLGSATITVTTADGAKTAACTVNVVERTPDVYVAGGFGVYVNGGKDARFDGNYHELNDVFVDAAGDVHAAGHFLYGPDWWNTAAAHYRNGERTALETGQSGSRSDASAVFVDGPNVYIAGYEEGDFDGDWKTVPMLWKNGQQSPLQSLPDAQWPVASSVRVHNGDVYAAGYAHIADDWHDRPVIWKNGVMHMREAAGYESERAIDFAVAPGGALYVLCSGYGYDGNYDDCATVWRVQPDLATWEMVSRREAGWNRGGIALDGDDWYAVSDDERCLKNGEPYALAHPSGTHMTRAQDVFVLNGDVYVAGQAFGFRDGGMVYHHVQWKNGAVVQLYVAKDLQLPADAEEMDDAFDFTEVRGLFVK
jgi:hypothetical protein